MSCGCVSASRVEIGESGVRKCVMKEVCVEDGQREFGRDVVLWRAKGRMEVASRKRRASVCGKEGRMLRVSEDVACVWRRAE